ncbi:13844_t:CDS:2 [Funneliformis mosseae]|uniref:13844_t:CDS:1 n=1 Tax=Funneliformis mosseae TaxID=27381 RepID=A0A9N9BAG7_FUNMO|nr:13844_t:CDS:2 [Funneliformis mosseae]
MIHAFSEDLKWKSDFLHYDSHNTEKIAKLLHIYKVPPDDSSNLVKNSLRDRSGIGCFETNDKPKELFMFKFCANEAI